MRVVVVGLGYVGLPLALLASRKGHRVVGVDQDERKVELINSRLAPFKDDRVAHELEDTSVAAYVSATSVEEAEVIILCVPTPVSEDKEPDLDPLRNATRSLVPHLRTGQLVVVESTVHPGVCEKVVAPILAESGQELHLAHCPERINPGDPVWSVENIPRVVGATTEEGLGRAVEFYGSILDADVRAMATIKETESVKVVENAWRDLCIAFSNELAILFDHLGIDLPNVIDGAATKPFGFMAHYPGCGVGGHCIPVDPHYLIRNGKDNGYHPQLLSKVRAINEAMPRYTVSKLEAALRNQGKELAGSKVAVLGISYKAGIDDTRHSPALEIVEILQRSGVGEVMVYDPYVPGQGVSTEDAMTGADAVVIATDHEEFKGIGPGDLNGTKVIIDGRNCLDKDAFKETDIHYTGIGRP